MHTYALVGTVLMLALMIIGSAATAFADTTYADRDYAASAYQVPAMAPQVEILYSKGVSLMPMLLVTGQIDGYIAWQPYATIAEKSEAGKLICLSSDLPPFGRWKGHPCCVLVAADDFIQGHYDIVCAMCALNIYATEYIKNNPSQSIDIMAGWLMGSSNFTFGEASVSTRELMQTCIRTINFSTQPSNRWKDDALIFIDREKEILSSSGQSYESTSNQSWARFFDTRPNDDAKAMIDERTLVIPEPVEEAIGLGCLIGDLHHAPLFVALKKWRYFNDTYGIALRPQDETAFRPSAADLLVNGRKVAELHLVSASSGAQLMTLMEQKCIQMTYVGIAPAIGANLLGAKTKIVQPVQNEGSGLVVSRTSPANDWNGFVSWAKERSSKGRPIRIADPQEGSVQDLLFRYALQEAGLRAAPAPEP